MLRPQGRIWLARKAANLPRRHARGATWVTIGFIASGVAIGLTTDASAQPSSMSPAPQGFVAGEVKDARFFPFAPRGSAPRWESGPHTLMANRGEAAVAPQLIDLQRYEGRALFLDVAQLPQFYGVRVLGSCDAALGARLWESTWDRGDFVLGLLENQAQHDTSANLADPTRAAPAASDAHLVAGTVKGGVFRRFQKYRLNGGPLEVRAILSAELGTGDSGAAPLVLTGYEGQALFASYREIQRKYRKKGDPRPDDALVGVQILGTCNPELGGALWGASTDRSDWVLRAR
jgi:hypothetical protein